MRIFTSASVIAILLAAPALASDPACNTSAQDQWMSKEAITTKVTAMGYDVRKVKAEGDCYEIYAISPEGQKVEALFHPVTGELVRGSDND
jgi:hypothetical protein